jgi:hypothetical protein
MTRLRSDCCDRSFRIVLGDPGGKTGGWAGGTQWRDVTGLEGARTIIKKVYSVYSAARNLYLVSITKSDIFYTI